MPQTTIDRLQQIVDRAFGGKLATSEFQHHLNSAPAEKHLSVITRAAAWGIIVLFLTVPLLAALGAKPNKLWIIWAAVSVWAALDSRSIGAGLSSRTHGVAGSRTLVFGLAAWNLLIALYAMFSSSVPLR